MKPSFILLQFLLSSFLAVVSADYGTTFPFHPLHKLKLRGKKVDAQLPEEVTTYSPVYVGNQVGLAELDKIECLPGQPEGVDFDQYSGYVTVDPAAGRALFYYLTEATEDADTKPLVLWLNGGPGCSSFGNGAMMELGPFRVNTDGKTLSRNDYAWNKVANILFLESPAGVGFSYSNTTSDYDKSGDTRTALDSYTFLVKWLERFPKYKTRDLYITGESYAGHYVPQLSYTILQNNNITNQTVINLQGIAIGNAYIDDETTSTGSIDFLWSHAFISDEVYDGIIANCNFSSEAEISDLCVAYLDKIDTGNIFFYDIYAPLCKGPSSKPSLGGFDPCSSQYILSYLNLPEVQKALHANLTSLPYPWTSCSSVINGWGDQPLTVLPTIEKLWQNNLRVWIYSGDTDDAIPVTCSRYAINKFKLAVNISWYPWYTDKEVGGFAIGYEKLSFVTVRGSGHFVPSYQPARALTLFSSFLEGRLPPRS